MKKPLQIPRLKHEWILIFSVSPQLALFFIPIVTERITEEVVPIVLIISLIGMMIFMGFNLSIPGFSLMAVGLLSNILVIIANRGWMPISPQTLKVLHPELPLTYWQIGTRLAHSKDFILAPENTKFQLLSDIFPVPHWINYKFAFSIGDVFIGLGVIVLIWSILLRMKEK